MRTETKKYNKGIALVLTGILAVLLLLCSCGSTRKSVVRDSRATVRVEDTVSRSHADSARVTERRVTAEGMRRVDSVAARDSVTVRDSIKVRQNASGGYDTERTRYVDRIKLVNNIQYRDRWRTDSTEIERMQARLDSVNAVNRILAENESKVTETKERVTPLWQKALMWLGAGCAVFVLLLVVGCIMQNSDSD